MLPFTKIVDIGRVNNGTLSHDALFQTEVTAFPGFLVGFNFDYTAKNVIEHGDSGGPWMKRGPAPHTVVAVNSGSSSRQVAARVDLVKEFIAEHIAAAEGTN